MNNMLLRARRVGALFAGAVLAVAVAAPAAAATAHTVPFSGTGSGTDTLAPAGCPAGSMHYTSQGEGTYSHLGHVTFTVSHCSVLNGPFAPGTTGTFGPGELVLTAANGDTLTLTESGSFVLVAVPGGVTSHITMQWQIKKGTGRFLGATGTGTGTGVSDFAAGTTAVQLTGSIAYDASHRSSH